jgi:hypothetical protein
MFEICVLDFDLLRHIGRFYTVYEIWIPVQTRKPAPIKGDNESNCGYIRPEICTHTGTNDTIRS